MLKHKNPKHKSHHRFPFGKQGSLLAAFQAAFLAPRVQTLPALQSLVVVIVVVDHLRGRCCGLWRLRCRLRRLRLAPTSLCPLNPQWFPKSLALAFALASSLLFAWIRLETPFSLALSLAQEGPSLLFGVATLPTMPTPTPFPFPSRPFPCPPFVGCPFADLPLPRQPFPCLPIP